MSERVYTQSEIVDAVLPLLKKYHTQEVASELRV